MNLFCMMSCFVGNSFCFYLLGIQMKYIRGKFYTNNLVGAISEIAAFSTSGILIKFLGIKPTLVIAYLIALTGMASLIFTSTLNQFYLSLMILGCKFGISCAKGTAYLANYQVFPVSIVATAFGLCNVVARVSTIFAPFVAELKPDSIAQYIFLGIMCFTSMTSMLIQENKEDEVTPLPTRKDEKEKEE